MLSNVKTEVIVPSGVSAGSFYELPAKRGEACTLFLKKLRHSPLMLDESAQINGVCKYQFVYSGTAIVGVVFTTPAAVTVNKGHTLTVGDAVDGENFTVQQTLTPLGLLLMVSDGSSVVITNVEADIPMVIKVDKK